MLLITLKSQISVDLCFLFFLAILFFILIEMLSWWPEKLIFSAPFFIVLMVTPSFGSDPLLTSFLVIVEDEYGVGREPSFDFLGVFSSFSSSSGELEKKFKDWLLSISSLSCKPVDGVNSVNSRCCFNAFPTVRSICFGEPLMLLTAL